MFYCKISFFLSPAHLFSMFPSQKKIVWRFFSCTALLFAVTCTASSRAEDTTKENPFLEYEETEQQDFIGEKYTVLSYEEIKAQQAREILHAKNTAIYELNTGLLNRIGKPFLGLYRVLVPRPLRKTLYNVARNLEEPKNFVFNLLQGDRKGASASLQRFFVNTTFGVLGTRDVMYNKYGVKQNKEDLAQVFSYHGAKRDKFLMSPLLGPSTPIDYFGAVLEFFLIPPYFFSVKSVQILTAINQNTMTLREIIALDSTDVALSKIEHLYKMYRNKMIWESPKTSFLPPAHFFVDYKKTPYLSPSPYQFLFPSSF